MTRILMIEIEYICFRKENVSIVELSFLEKSLHI